MAPLPPQQKPGLFTQKKPEINPEVLTLLSSQMNSLSSRLRILEERFTNMRNKSQVSESNMLSNNKKTNAEFKTINSEIIEIRKEMSAIKNEVRLVIKELQLSAKREDVKTLEKYIELWQPLNFVTRAEVEKIVKSILEEQSKRFINV